MFFKKYTQFKCYFNISSNNLKSFILLKLFFFILIVNNTKKMIVLPKLTKQLPICIGHSN